MSMTQKREYKGDEVPEKEIYRLDVPNHGTK